MHGRRSGSVGGCSFALCSSTRLLLLLLLCFLPLTVLFQELFVVAVIVVSPSTTLGTLATPILSATIVVALRGFPRLGRIAVNDTTLEILLNIVISTTTI